LLLGAVIQPTPFARINLNYDKMQSRAATDVTTSNAFTRTSPDSFYHIRGRLTVKPTKWLSLFGTVNDYTAKNDDPFVNHREHMYDFSFGTSIMASESFAVDFNYAHDNFYSRTDICYTATPAPTGAATGGTCATSTSNPLLGTGLYDVPTNFVSGSILWSPTRRFRFNGGVRVNTLNGSAEQLSPLMAPGALQSHFLVPYADAQFNIAPQWTWHGNWTRDDYTENGLQGPLPSRSTSGNITTLGVKYAF
jgi:hypothetical protein